MLLGRFDIWRDVSIIVIRLDRRRNGYKLKGVGSSAGRRDIIGK